ncbi:hypothetical protein J5U22_02130 [Saccharolobus shibatae]|uniref:Uncharacterized protein n=1 Tax=Saccharolobus shibatae TaxID=2286 RepID=A0A8F5C200_9CREN|nr:hypothetical protein J5U22_02130 [Saccharolobus shibatae]
MVDYSLALLNVMYPVIYSREMTSLNEAYWKGVENIREKSDIILLVDIE